MIFDGPGAFLPPLLLGALGATHCATMCGGIVGATGAGTDARVRLKVASQISILLSQNAGRIFSYGAAGALAGGFASLAAAASFTGARSWLQVFSGLMMLGIGLFLVGVLPRFATVERIGLPIWRRLEPIGRRFLPLRTSGHAFGFGLVWGWLPCGLVYSALSIAVGTGSAKDGALTMIAFGLGTAPALLAMGTMASAVSRAARRPVVRAGAGLVIAAFGVLHLQLASARLLSPEDGGTVCRHCATAR
ncbi:MAG: sulfite exporter TauE/SafE family protein [Polyangiaceae bacterium]